MTKREQIEKYLEERGWEHVMTAEDGCDTWSFPWERRKEWPWWARHHYGTQHYWYLREALLLEAKISAHCTRAEHYKDFKWIKVKRYKDDEAKTWEERYRALDDHHIKETMFLVDEIRRLAAEIDELVKEKPVEDTVAWTSIKQKWNLTDEELKGLES